MGFGQREISRDSALGRSKKSDFYLNLPLYIYISIYISLCISISIFCSMMKSLSGVLCSQREISRDSALGRSKKSDFYFYLPLYLSISIYLSIYLSISLSQYFVV